MSTSISPLGQTTNSGASVISLTPPAAGALLYTLSPSQSGCIIQVPALTAAGNIITLPPVASASGCRYNIVCTGILAQILTITAPANTMRGFALQKSNDAANSYAGFVVAGAGGTNTSIRLAATNAVGDNVSIFCDGSYYYVQGFSASAIAGATFSFA